MGQAQASQCIAKRRFPAFDATRFQPLCLSDAREARSRVAPGNGHSYDLPFIAFPFVVHEIRNTTVSNSRWGRRVFAKEPEDRGAQRQERDCQDHSE